MSLWLRRILPALFRRRYRLAVVDLTSKVICFDATEAYRVGQDLAECYAVGITQESKVEAYQVCDAVTQIGCA